MSGREKKIAAITFCHYIDNCSPWEDIIRKKVLKLRSIAELRMFDGLFNLCSDWEHLSTHIHTDPNKIKIRGKNYFSHSAHQTKTVSLTVHVYVHPSLHKYGIYIFSVKL